jgi:hypothetical protein
MAKGGKKNIQNEITDEMKKKYGNNKDLICKALNALYGCTKSVAARQKICRMVSSPLLSTMASIA